MSFIQCSRYKTYTIVLRRLASHGKVGRKKREAPPEFSSEARGWMEWRDSEEKATEKVGKRRKAPAEFSAEMVGGSRRVQRGEDRGLSPLTIQYVVWTDIARHLRVGRMKPTCAIGR